MRLAALPSGAPPVAPAPGPGASPALAAIPALAANPAPAASPVPLPGLAAVPGPALVPGLAAPPDPAPDAPTRMAALPAEPLPASPAPAPIAPSPPPVGLAVRRGKVVGYPGAQAPGTIVVDTAARLLYLVRGDGTAVRYRVAVGRPGTTWKGTETVTAKQEWPQWTPTPEMRRSRPGLPRHVAGGPRNPLGARALYLGSSLYRIHGTTDPTSIGRAASAGCFRMLNEDVIELYRFVPVGTKVQVI
ncbi:hypothetical protein DK419_16435 [Methylobacterium terrae]|uniref:L,D-TPase catalytic domain-containing protein n=2 Tax=Methylobacterium terrae TaxID=2202827 RepID=A0A2U8WXE4_9HYPH|nr:L,D-transpeptidase [Methylobacterium terrae]AWN50091.1 hypothetical protein DK419_16435 [Methylobacterium terrae]